jgi:hypothetical protein
MKYMDIKCDNMKSWNHIKTLHTKQGPVAMRLAFLLFNVELEEATK